MDASAATITCEYCGASNVVDVPEAAFESATAWQQPIIAAQPAQPAQLGRTNLTGLAVKLLLAAVVIALALGVAGYVAWGVVPRRETIENTP